MAGLTVILPGTFNYDCEEIVKQLTYNEVKQIFNQCKNGMKFRFENDFSVPDSDRVFRFKYAKVDIEEKLQEVALWNNSGLVAAFKVCV